jgi:cell wall-associated NlpC family hydrolase
LLVTERPAPTRWRPRRLARLGLALLTPLAFAAALVIPGAPAAQAITLNAPMIGIAAAANGSGYYLAGSDGGVFSFPNTLPFHGSLGGTKLNAPIVGIVSDPATGGYWMVGSDGGVFTFDAPFYGSMGGTKLNAPIVGMAATPDDKGYILVGADGGIFNFGDAVFHGSLGGTKLSAPVESIAYDSATQGYWLGAKDGGVFSFNAPFYGSLGGSTYPVTPPPPTSTAQAIINAAYSQLGVPYVWGDEDPGVGFDCSGLAQWAYAQAGLSIPRTTETQWPAMQHVTEAQAVPGDLVFFNTPGDSQAPPNHVGIYLGDGLMIDAPYTGTVVRKDSITSDVLYGFATMPGI